MPNPSIRSIDAVNLDDRDQYAAFLNTIIADGAERVREERTQANRDGLIDEQGYVVPSFTQPQLIAEGTTRITRITFFRHGESTGNAGETTYDPANIPLTAKGREQAERIAQGDWSKLTLVVVSSYVRTHETAAPLLARIPHVPVEEWPVQEFTYLEPASCVGTTGAERLPRVRRYWESARPEERDGPGAESFSELLRRADQMRTRLEALPAGSQVAVFSHGQFLQALRLLVHFLALEDLGMKHGFPVLDRKFPIENAGRIEGVVLRGRLGLLERLRW